MGLQLKEVKVEFESRLEEVMLSTQKKNESQEFAESLKSEVKMEIGDLQNQLYQAKAEKKNENQEFAESLKSEVKSECKAEVRKEVDKVLPTAVEQGLRDLPFEMVCAYKHDWQEANSTVSYDRIAVEFNNADRPGGADGTMNIETGVFTAVTSGYYIITYSGTAVVRAGDYTDMYLYQNGVRVEESRWYTKMEVGSGDNLIKDQGSRTVILHLLAGDTLDLRTTANSLKVHRITL